MTFLAAQHFYPYPSVVSFGVVICHWNWMVVDPPLWNPPSVCLAPR